MTGSRRPAQARGSTKKKLLPGQDFELQIRRAVRASDVVLVLSSERSVTKAGYVQKEIKIALDEADKQPEGAIFIIPVRLEACRLPDRLIHLHWVDLFEPDGHESLLASLQARAGELGRAPLAPGAPPPPGKAPPRETTTVPIAAPPKFVASRPDHESPARPEAQPANPRQLMLDLKEIFSTRFSLEELKGFCLQLGIDYENLPHGSKSSLARELALYLERRSLLQEAISAGKVLRPDIEWDRLLAQ